MPAACIAGKTADASSVQPFASSGILPLSPAAADAELPTPAPQAESSSKSARNRGNNRFFITDTSFLERCGARPLYFLLLLD